MAFQSKAASGNSDGNPKDSSRSQRAKQKAKLTGYNCPSDDSEASLYRRCRERADLYVEQFIAEQDAANKCDLQDNVSLRNFERKVGRESFRSKAKREGSTEGSTKVSGRSKQERSDTEVSQITQSSSEESKTYSQVYSEIYEESRARQEKAEHIRKVYTNKKSNFNRSRSRERTERWVQDHLDQAEMEDEYITEASNDSESESEYPEGSLNKDYLTEEDYEQLVQEQLVVIARYQEESRCGYENYIDEYISELAEELKDQEQQEASSKGQESFSEGKEEQYENQATARTQIYEVTSPKASSSKQPKTNNKPEVQAEVLQFEHCEIYVKQSDKGKDLKKTPVETIPSVRSEGSCLKETDQEHHEESFEDATEYSEQSEENSSRNSRKLKEGKSQASLSQLEEKSSRLTSPRQSSDSEANSTQSPSSHIEEEKSQSIRSRESSESSLHEVTSLKLLRESSQDEVVLKHKFPGRRETNCESDSSRQVEGRKSRRNTYRLNRSERASNNSHKARHAPTNSTSPSERSIKAAQEAKENSFDDYCLSSKSGTGELTSPVSSSRSQVPKTYHDRGSSPIQVICSERELEALKDEEVSASSELSKERSQLSIVSEEKGVQYPSGDELELTPTKKKLQIYNLDEAMLQVPQNYKGKAILFDNEDELLDLSLSDDELLLRAKQQATAWSDRQKSSPNSSSNNCSIGCSNSCSNSCSSSSICSYVPSVRYQRRTQEENDEVYFEDTHKDTYEKHVARLAERALRACSNYCAGGGKLGPGLEQEIADKVRLLYNSEMRFNTQQRLIEREELLQQFNRRLQQQLQLIAPSFQ